MFHSSVCKNIYVFEEEVNKNRFLRNSLSRLFFHGIFRRSLTDKRRRNEDRRRRNGDSGKRNKNSVRRRNEDSGKRNKDSGRRRLEEEEKRKEDNELDKNSMTQ